MSLSSLLDSTIDESDTNMETMDVSLNYDNPDLMSSEFFDSVLSLENNMEEGFLSSFEDDINLSSDTSSHIDEVLSPQSLYSESDKNSLFAENLDETVTPISVDTYDDPFLLSLLNPVPMPAITHVTTDKPTRILIQNPNNKKCIAKPIINTNQLKKAPLKIKPQILKVQPLMNNGRPVFVPLNVKNIKILNPSVNLANLKTHKTDHVSSIKKECEMTSTNHYPPLDLTQEERKLLAKEGIQLPTHHPLTKSEERELKRIRRKIRNKISAQDSRKRKKEYVDGLEERVKRGSEENKNLLQRVRALQKQNRTLIAQVNKLQAMIRNSTTSKATPSTCLMVVLLSALLVSLPNMKLFENKNITTEQEQVAVRRSLLSSPQAAEEDLLNMEEFLIFKDEEEYKSKLGEEALDAENSTDKQFNKMLDEIENKYAGGFLPENNSSLSFFSRIIQTVKSFLDKKESEIIKKDCRGFTKGFIEPDIDEYIPYEDGPPVKRMKSEDNNETNQRVVSTTVNTNHLGINTKNK